MQVCMSATHSQPWLQLTHMHQSISVQCRCLITSFLESKIIHYLQIEHAHIGAIFSAAYRANNILITVAESLENIFFSSSDPTTAEYLCSFQEGELGESAYLPCTSALQGKFVQVQNQLLAFHFMEVEVFGF